MANAGFGQQTSSQPNSANSNQSFNSGLRKVINFFLISGVFSIIINLIAAYLYPSLPALFQSTEFWLGVEFCIAVLAFFYPLPTNSNLSWYMLKIIIRLLFFVGFILNLFFFTFIHVDFPGAWFRGQPVLYDAGPELKSGLKNFSFPQNSIGTAWSVDANGTLESSGQEIMYYDLNNCPTSDHLCPTGYSTIQLPFQPDKVTAYNGEGGLQNYAVEARILYNGGSDKYETGFGIGIHRHFDKESGNIDEGYGFCVMNNPASSIGFMVFLYRQPCIAKTNDEHIMDSKLFSPAGEQGHLYRIEYKDSNISLYIDGNLVLHGFDTKYKRGGWVELWSERAKIQVTGLKIIQI